MQRQQRMKEIEMKMKREEEAAEKAAAQGGKVAREADSGKDMSSLKGIAKEKVAARGGKNL